MELYQDRSARKLVASSPASNPLLSQHRSCHHFFLTLPLPIPIISLTTKLPYSNSSLLQTRCSLHFHPPPTTIAWFVLCPFPLKTALLVNQVLDCLPTMWRLSPRSTLSRHRQSNVHRHRLPSRTWYPILAVRPVQRRLHTQACTKRTLCTLLQLPILSLCPGTPTLRRLWLHGSAPTRPLSLLYFRRRVMRLMSQARGKREQPRHRCRRRSTPG